MSIAIQWLNQYAREKKLLGTMSQRIQELEVEIGRLKGKWEEGERRVILSESQNYCKICGNTLDGYIPPREQEVKE